MRVLLPCVMMVLVGCGAGATASNDGQVADLPSADLPSADLPGRDAPAMDAPESPCGVCAGTSQLCAHAPGCLAATPRFCAPDTCGDAIAIPYCGCDGVTFYSGCLFPNRPYRHAGACVIADGGDGGLERPADLVTDGGTGCADNGSFRRTCQCSNVGNPTVACGESRPCRLYPNGCLEAGTVPCVLRGYRDVPGLRERCLAFCASLRAAEPGAVCPIAAP